jgi:hypothetical protein
MLFESHYERFSDIILLVFESYLSVFSGVVCPAS